MKALKIGGVLLLFGLCLPMIGSVDASLGYGRQYYGGWNYHGARGYYYSRYYYRPTPTYTSYNYHYCIYYPQSRYVNYYNPYQGHYWGRYDCQATGPNVYSLLAPADRKADLKAIPEKAFPKPGPLPNIPESKDNVGIKPLDLTKLPKGTPGPGALPGKN